MLLKYLLKISLSIINRHRLTSLVISCFPHVIWAQLFDQFVYVFVSPDIADLSVTIINNLSVTIVINRLRSRGLLAIEDSFQTIYEHACLDIIIADRVYHVIINATNPSSRCLEHTPLNGSNE